MSADDDEEEGGFSFGARAPEDDGGDIDAIEVSGEPVSRSEAKKLGYAHLDAVRERSATSVMRLDELPSDLPKGLAKKVEAAWNHLKKNEIDEAMTLAQDVVFERPTLVAAKLIIARCFINRKEYEKALALLQAIPEDEKNAECWYYIGLCQSRCGRIKDAVESLQFCRSTADDALLAKRAGDLLLHLQGEQIECPVCGKKVLYDSMVEVGSQTVCANCAKTAAGGDDDDDDYYDDDEDDGGSRKRKRLRPPMTKSDILIRLLFVGFICFVLSFGMYLLYMLAPGYYQMIRDFLPAHWSFPPHVPVHVINEPPPIQNTGVTEIPSMEFTSPLLDRAAVNIPITHKAEVEGMQNFDSVYTVVIYPDPAGPYEFDESRGILSWTPLPEDGGKTFEITFTGEFGRRFRARPQSNEVFVSEGPTVTRIAEGPFLGENRKVQLAAYDIDGDGTEELFVSSGGYWDSRLTILKPAGGSYAAASEVRLRGMAAGLGIIKAGDENWIAAADFWNSRISYYAFRSGRLSEMPMTIELPGRPVMAAFAAEESMIAVLCRTGTSMQVLLLRQENQINYRTVAEWTVPDDQVWKKIFLLRGRTPDSAYNVCLLGADFAASMHVLVPGQDQVRNVRHGMDGVLTDAVTGGDRETLHCLVEKDGGLKIVSLIPPAGREGTVSPSVIDAGGVPALAGFALADLSGLRRDDFVILKTGQVRLSLADGQDGRLGGTADWPLPEAALLFGSAVSMRLPGPDAVQAAVFAGEDGGLWSVTMPLPKE